ncbi:HR-like lesion-inducing protein [Quillaja saponaria]|uniref:HR-like lesion-inducing protein n=1 Tax=Quillaja saponaria TaxID=32244 RepID=A0AAD7LAZ4_QUISA|nr:HR-like lesion-inducing protein [Quillaja saponaria]
MGFVSFLGRVLFASVFILSAWQMFNEFDANGGPFAKELAPRLTAVRKNLSVKLGMEVPEFNVRNFVSTIIFLQGIGGILFVFGSNAGSFLLLLHLVLTTPLLYDFYNYGSNKPEFSLLLNDFLQRAALFGALLFYVGMKKKIPKRQFKKKGLKTKSG